MATCLYCRRRKGKRDCPALGGRICPACCGEHRVREINCPPDCVHLGNEDYQRRRTFDRVPPAWIERIARYEGRDHASQETVHEIQLALCRYARERPLDRQGAREGLEFARRRMSPIRTPEPFVPPFGEFLVDRLDALIGERSLVEKEGVRAVLDEILRSLGQEVPPGTFEAFLDFLRALYADQLSAERRESSSSIVLP